MRDPVMDALVHQLIQAQNRVNEPAPFRDEIEDRKGADMHAEYEMAVRRRDWLVRSINDYVDTLGSVIKNRWSQDVLESARSMRGERREPSERMKTLAEEMKDA